MFKKYLLPEIVLILVVALGIIAWEHTKEISPKDINVPAIINLENVSLTSKKQFEVQIKNPNNKSAKIAKIYTSCGCTTYIGNGDGDILIKPKSTIYLTFEIDPEEMHKIGDTLNHEIYILTTNPTEKEYIIKLTGIIV